MKKSKKASPKPMPPAPTSPPPEGLPFGPPAGMKKGGATKEVDKADCEKPKNRFDRVKRRTGGRVGADCSPLSSAAK